MKFDPSNFWQAVGQIYIQLGQLEKAQELLRKATKVDSRDAQVTHYWKRVLLWLSLHQCVLSHS